MGTAPDRKIFKIPKSLLCRHSDYFRVPLKDGNEDRFVEAEKGEFSWPDDDPEEFHRYVRWMYSCSSCRQGDFYNSVHVCKKDGELKKDPYSWCAPGVEAEQAFVLGDRILSGEYCRYALASFIQHVHRMDPRRLGWVLENTSDRSPLHRFARAWLGWLKFKLDKRLVSADEDDDAAVYAGLFASFDGWLTTDPRKYLMEHWSEPCSLEPNLACGHKRAHWFWRRTASGQPGQPPGREPRPRSRREMVWEGSLGVWVSDRAGLCCLTPEETTLTLVPPPVLLLHSDACPLRVHSRKRPRRPGSAVVEAAQHSRGLLCLCGDVHLRQLGAVGFHSYSTDCGCSCDIFQSTGCEVFSGMSTMPISSLRVAEANGRARLPQLERRYARSRRGSR